jgi:trimeric autotransporter adhesin
MINKFLLNSINHKTSIKLSSTENSTTSQLLNKQTSMKKIYVMLIAMITLAVSSFGQNVNVNPGAGSYPDLASAFAAINAGTHTGNITVDIVNNTTEPAAGAILNASGSGSASYTSILIQPSGGVARVINGTSTSGLPLVDLNGADNVTFNGLNTGGNSLTIQNGNALSTSGTSTIRFIGGATNNTITNCIINGSASASVATNGATIFFSTDGTTANGNDNNTISNNNIGSVGAALPSKAILGSGSTTTTAIGNSGITITNNNIFDYFGAAVTSAGIAVNGGCNTWSITNNRFYQTGTRTWTTGALHTPILMSSSTATSGVQGMTITGNIIGYASNTQTGTYTLTGSTGKFQGIFFSGITAGNVSNISNNSISAVSLTGVTSSGIATTTSPMSGIIIDNGLVTTNNNTIGSQTATGSLVFSTNSTTATNVYGIYNFSTDVFNAADNNIGGISVTNAAASGTFIIFGLRANTATTVAATLTSNLVGGTIANSIQLTSTGAASQVIGIQTANAPAVFISNTVRNLTNNNGTGTTTAASVIGINITTTTPNHTLSQNRIFNLTNTNTTAATIVTGIQFTGGTANVVERNLIYDLTTSTNNASAEVNGIRVGGGTTIYRNNMIRLGAGIANAIGGAATNSSTTGINGINEFLGTDQFFHNSVYIGGAPTAGTGASYAFNGTQTTNTRSFRDNIFFNARSNSGASGKNYAVKINGTTANPVGLTINNNDYFVNGTGGTFGFFNSADVATLAAWQTAVGQDVASINVDPAFLSTTDLHIGSTSPVVDAGANVGVTNDFDADVRPFNSLYDIGADEYVATCAGTPTGGTVAAASQNVCVGVAPSALVLTGYTSGPGITLQWEQADDAAFTVNVQNAIGGTGATTATYTPPVFAGTNIYYRCKVTCTPSASSANSSIASVLAPSTPSTQASAVVGVAATATSAVINWTSGNGGRRFVVLNTTNSFTDPVGTADVTGVSSVYAGGEQKVYDGTASTVTVTGLTAGTIYYVRVYEYLRCVGTPNVNYYNISTAAGNPSSFATPVIPANDECTGAITLTPQAYVALPTCPSGVSGTTLGATLSSSTAPPTTAFSTSNEDDVWYDFVATNTTHIVRLCNVTFPIGATVQMGIVLTNGCLSTSTEVTGNPTGSLITLVSGAGEMSFSGLTIGTTYKVRILTGGTTSRANFDISILNLPAMSYVSSTTTQVTGTVNAGSSNQGIVRLEVTVTGSLSPLSVSSIDFNTNGTTTPANITNARVFYTGTSTTFSTTTPFGSVVPTPGATPFTVSGSPQVLTGGLTNTVNYFWLVYDVACNAVNPDVLDAECTGFNIGSAQVPTVTAPAGSRTITSFVPPVVATNQPLSGVNVSPGTVNAQIVRVDVPASSCLGTITQLDFTNASAVVGDVIAARVYYTTTTTFATTNLFGTAATTGATFSVTGSQASAGSGTNYFWLVFDVNCTTTGANIDAGCTNVTATLGNYAPATPNPTGVRPIVAATSYTTIANGEWSASSTWQCGTVPPSNATAVTIANAITVSDAGNVGGNVTINSGASLTINGGGALTLGVTGGDNKTLTNNGTLAVTGGTLTQNGNIVSNSGSTFNQSGGNINIDGNAAGVIANSVASGTSILQFNQLNSGINLTGGTLTIVDPHAAATASYAINVNNVTAGTQTSTANHTLVLGDGVSTDAGGNALGFLINTWFDTEYLSFGNIIINGGTGTNRVVNNEEVLASVGDFTINANSTLNTTAGIFVGKDLLVNATGSLINNTTVNGVIMTLIASNTFSGFTFTPSTVPQSITNNGVIANASASPTANVNAFRVNNSSVSGVTLNSPISISGTFTMTAGRINTTSTNLITLGYNATNVGTLTYTAGRINGPFKRWISTTTGARQFPVGNATSLEDANINFTAAPTTGGSLTAVWADGQPGFPNATPLTEGAITNINGASAVGSWIIDAADGLAGGTYTSIFKPLACPDVTDYTKTVLLKRPSAGGDWILDGTHVTTTGSNAAPTLSRTGMVGFSQFALGGKINVALPISVNYLQGTKQGSVHNLNWKVTCTSSPSATMVLERSGNNRTFAGITTITADALRCAQPFGYVDASPLAGINYYRLRITDAYGKVTYSNTIAMVNKQTGIDIVGIAPNPVTSSGTATLNVASAQKGTLRIMVTDITGRQLLVQTESIIAGSNAIPMNVAKLAAGSYQVTAITDDGKSTSVRFVKQ